MQPVSDTLQKDSIDNALRFSLLNALASNYWNNTRDNTAFKEVNLLWRLSFVLFRDYFKIPTDDLPVLWGGVRKFLRKYFEECAWFKVYDLIEFVANTPFAPARNAAFMAECNQILEREKSAYRFVGTVIAPITSEHEIVAIEKAIATAEASKPLNLIAIHLRQAVASLADRHAPDFRNSMKESISAVEALCKVITGDDKATLGKALNQIESKRLVPMHPHIKAAFQSLYSYTNDAGGIRHALKDEPDVGLEDATFMLVTCSAFVNYMVEKVRKVGIAL